MFNIDEKSSKDFIYSYFSLCLSFIIINRNSCLMIIIILKHLVQVQIKLFIHFACYNSNFSNYLFIYYC